MEETSQFFESRMKGFIVSPHAHDRYEFIYFLSGSGQLHFDKQTFHFRKNSYFLMHPHTVHDESYDEASDILVCWFDLPHTFKINSDARQDTTLDIYRLVEQISKELQKHSHGFSRMVNALIEQITVLVSRVQHPDEQDASHILQTSVEYINEYYMTPIKIENLAKTCGYGCDQYRLLFKRITKMLPKEYILNKRLDLAKDFLIKTELSVSEICFRCGFDYESHFSSFFKKTIGVSPLEYRNRNNKKERVE